MKNFTEKLNSLEGKDVAFRFKNFKEVYIAKLIKVNQMYDTLIVSGSSSKEEYFTLSSLYGFFEVF